MSQKLANKIIFILSLVGILVSVYLWLHAAKGIPLVCGFQGCEVVQASIYSKFLGVPLAAIGFAFYAFLAFVSFLWTIVDSKTDNFLRQTIIISSGAGFLISLYLTYLEIFVIRALCFWCVVSAVLITLIFILSLVGKRTTLR